MATKSILKNVTIRNNRNAAMLACALEKAQNKTAKEILAPKANIASVEDIRRIFAIK